MQLHDYHVGFAKEPYFSPNLSQSCLLSSYCLGLASLPPPKSTSSIHSRHHPQFHQPLPNLFRNPNTALQHSPWRFPSILSIQWVSYLDVQPRSSSDQSDDGEVLHVVSGQQWSGCTRSYPLLPSLPSLRQILCLPHRQRRLQGMKQRIYLTGSPLYLSPVLVVLECTARHI